MQMIKIFKPLNNHPVPFLSHAGDTFREIIDLWEQNGFVEVIRTSNIEDKANNIMKDESGLVWLNKIGDILLYDRPNFDWIPKQMDINAGLFANSPPPNITKAGREIKTVPWIFWGRHPKMLEEKSKECNKSYDERSIQSIFIGNIENSVQNTYRGDKSEWANVVSKFEIVNGKQHKYSHDDYLNLLADSKFGLCLRGYGPKCNREIELMALGVVPLLTDDVDVTYSDRLIEGLHYFRVNTPSDLTNLTNNVTKERWQLMSNACRTWYKRNASIRGSFDTTMKIVASITNKKSRTMSISTMASNTCWDDLQLMLFSLYQFHPTIDVFVVCDNIIENNLKDWTKKYTPQLKITTVPTLTEYSNQNRREMEQSGKWLEFMLRKCDSIDMSFEKNFDCTLFVDCDMVFLNEINFDDFNLNSSDLHSGIGRSKHECKAENHKLYGLYNGGFLWIDRPGFTDWWKLMSRVNSRFYEQAPLEDIHKFYECFDVPIQYNFGWWRLYECEPQQVSERERKFRVQNGIILYDDLPIRTIHTHFGDKTFIHTVRFNAYMKKLFVAVKDSRVQNVIKAIDNLFYLNLPIQTELNNSVSSDTNTDNTDKTKTDVTTNNNDNTNISSNTKNDIHVVVPYYNDSNVARQSEYEFCIQSNLENEHVRSVHILFKDDGTLLPEWLKNHPKFIGAKFVGSDNTKWLTYKEVVEYSNLKLSNNIVALLHLDVFLGNTDWKQVVDYTNRGVVLCLGRYEFNGVNEAKKDDLLRGSAFCSTQDAWIFQSPLKMDTNLLKFEIGKRGSDNAFADRLVKSNYIPFNDTTKFPILHYDIVNKSRKTDIGHSNKVNSNEYDPTSDGYYFVPDQTVTSIDSLIKSMGICDLDKYQIICGILSKFAKN